MGVSQLLWARSRAAPQKNLHLCLHGLLPERPGIITPILKSLHWLKIPEHIHLKVRSLTWISLQYSQLTYLHELFTIQLTRFTRSSSSCLTLYQSLDTFMSYSPTEPYPITITAPRLWNDLPPELHTWWR